MREAHKTGQGKNRWRWAVSIASVFIYGLSFFLPTYEIVDLHSGVKSVELGYSAFVGAIMPFVNDNAINEGRIPPAVIWLANVIWVASIVFCLVDRRSLSLVSAVSACVLGSLAVNAHALVGYYVWMLSFSIMEISGLSPWLWRPRN